ncbi:islet cell autoantigen 1-like isoform X1, partial [Brachionus plicatilis]
LGHRFKSKFHGYDKYSEHQDQTPLGKLQQQYWTTRQQMIKKLGQKEDEYVVMSDAELDSKLDMFEAIEQSSVQMLKIIEMYQEKLINLSIEESEMSRLLKSQSTYDTKTKAGKMMAAVSKSQNFSSQQRTALRLPLVRLYNEVETFQNKAIRDTLITIRKMESYRTEYRGALLWMKNVSNELDPDTTKKLEKFRRVQAQVKKTKTKFDKFKNDVIQKIDLLSASRCNMFSHALVSYTQTLIMFWQKTAKTMGAVADAFKGYQYYEFNIIKDLVEPSRKLAQLVKRTESQEEAMRKENEEKSEEKLIEIEQNEKEDQINELIDLMTESESTVLNEQLKELELLDKEKQEKLNKIQKEQANKSPS